MTVGSGFSPDLLDPVNKTGARGLFNISIILNHRRWEISSRPEKLILMCILEVWSGVNGNSFYFSLNNKGEN